VFVIIKNGEIVGTKCILNNVSKVLMTTRY